MANNHRSESGQMGTMATSYMDSRHALACDEQKRNQRGIGLFLWSSECSMRNPDQIPNSYVKIGRG
jgi:hypothetical protein